MRYPDQHLSADELESLGREEGLSDGLREDLGAAREHVQSCPSCRRRLEVYPTTAAKLEKLRAPKKAPKRPDCPPVEVWLNLAGGLLTTDEKERYVAHAANCDHCGPVLREIVHDFGEPVTEEEKAVLAELKDPSNIPQPKPAAHNEPVAQVVPSGIVPPSRSWFALPTWQFATAAVVILAAVGFSLYRVGIFRKEDSVASVNQLLAQAYTEQRTIEPRIPGAQYAPIRVERGPKESNLSRPKALLQADSTIAENLDEHPDDPVWLQLKARADLLDGNYEVAIQALNRAKQTDPRSPSIATDLATAYFERADTENHPIDYGTAIEILSVVITNNSNDEIALFNRAVTYERMFLYRESIVDWKRYLVLDSDSDWGKEARRHLDELQKKLADQEALSTSPLISLGTLASVLRENSTDTLAKIDSRIEEYLGQTATESLPLAFPVTNWTQKYNPWPQEIGGIRAVAGILERLHGDRWLVDLIAQPASRSFKLGLLELSASIRANDSGDPIEAERRAISAERWFHQAGNRAGEIRAAVEEVYGLHRALKGQKCLQRVATLSRITAYPWIQIQLFIEQSSCWSMVGHIGKAEIAIRNALAIAQLSHYRTLGLRALGISATLDTAKGNGSDAWKKDYDGLRQFWSGIFPTIRAFQFYSDLGYPMEEAQQWHVAAAIAREALRSIAATKNRSTEAIAHFRLAQVDTAAGAHYEAESEFKIAAQMFQSLPHTVATANYLADSQIALAKMEAERGQNVSAAAYLATAKPQLSMTSSHFTALAFYEAMADIDLAMGKESDAEKTLLAAIAIAESKMHSLTSAADRLSWQQQTVGVYKQIVRLRIRENAQQQALEFWEWYRSAPIRSKLTGDSHTSSAIYNINGRYNFSTLYDKPPLFNPTDVSTSLQSLGTITILSYADLVDGPVLWIYDDRGVYFERIPESVSIIRETVARFLAECSDPKSDVGTFHRDGRQLYDWLMGPAKAYLDTRRTLIIEPDVSTSGLPFEALIMPTGEYLGSKNDIVISPGLIYMLNFRNPVYRISGYDHALIVGSPSISAQLGSTFPPLTNALVEAQNVATHFKQPRLLTESAATLDAVKRELPKAAIFHFAGHGILGVRNAGLLLSSAQQSSSNGASILDYRQIGRLRLPKSKLVVLSACSSGRENVESVGDSMSIAKAFIMNGVPQIVATHWNVDSASTTIFISSFYDALIRGETTPAALRIAAERIRRRPEYSHPYYWAAFSVFGKANNKSRKTRRTV